MTWSWSMQIITLIYRQSSILSYIPVSAIFPGHAMAGWSQWWYTWILYYRPLSRLAISIHLNRLTLICDRSWFLQSGIYLIFIHFFIFMIEFNVQYRIVFAIFENIKYSEFELKRNEEKIYCLILKVLHWCPICHRNWSIKGASFDGSYPLAYVIMSIYNSSWY